MTSVRLEGMFLIPFEASAELPAWGIGLITLALLLTALAVVRGIGKSRPHS